MQRASSGNLWWAKPCLFLAGAHNILWSAMYLLFPNYWFETFGMSPPNYPPIWQFAGVLIGLMGMGYLIAANDYRRYWPLVFIGLLTKILGPISFVWSAWQGVLPWKLSTMILVNDVIWWLPFAAILWDTAKRAGGYDSMTADDQASMQDVLSRTFDQQGRSLLELSHQRPVLVLLMRHAGCTFCKEALADLRAEQAAIEAAGFGIVVVVMSHPEVIRRLTQRYRLENISWVSDRDRVLYRFFKLPRGSFFQLFGPIVWWRGLLATLRGHLVGKLDGDGFQMPGAFLIYRGSILKEFRHKHAAQKFRPAQFVMKKPLSVT